MSDLVKVVHIDDEIGTTPEAVIQDGTTFYYLLIDNISANTIQVSFDGGTTWKQSASGDTLEITAPGGKQVKLSDPLKMKSSATSNFEILMIQDYHP